MDDDAIRTLISRIARPRAAGGQTIERAALLASGADFTEVIAWITDHHGEPETLPTPRAVGRGGGLHGGRLHSSGVPGSSTPARYILPAGVLH